MVKDKILSLLRFKSGSVKKESADVNVPTVSVDDLKPSSYAGQQQSAGAQSSLWDGEKFFGGLGAAQILSTDYYTMRLRSLELFTQNLYARGLVRRLVTNEINTGLNPESCPDEAIIGVPEDSLTDWTEDVENRFSIWGSNETICDYSKERNMQALQYQCRLQATVSGDVLVILRQSKDLHLPVVELVDGKHVCNPFSETYKKYKHHTIKQGVERNRKGNIVAYHVKQDDGSTKRIEAFGRHTGRKTAWLVFGNERMLDDERGLPLLSIIIQSLREIDRYRDSAQRGAVVNSILAMFIKKTSDKPSSLMMSGGAVRKDNVVVDDNSGTGSRTLEFTQHVPGLVAQELQVGEEPVPFQQKGTDTNFPVFEEAMLQAIAWSNQMPPEILKLSFSNNYSASQAAINEFKIYLNMKWFEFGNDFCQPIYEEWLISEVLNRRIAAPGLLEAWRDRNLYDIFGAWMSCDWYGSVKPSTDLSKSTKGSEILVKNGWSTNSREARGLNGSKFSKNMKRVKRENELKAEAMRPLLELEREFAVERNVSKKSDHGNKAESIDFEEIREEIIEELG